MTDTALLPSITAEQANFYKIIPKGRHGNKLVFFSSRADARPRSELVNELSIVLGADIILENAAEEWISASLLRDYPVQKKDTRIRSLTFTGNQEDFLQHLIAEAKALRSSDIHIEIYEDSCRVRIRIDGELARRYDIDRKDYPSIVNKIKIMSGLDISEKRLPQDGRIFFTSKAGGGAIKFDIRVSVLPTLHGEKIVLRLLNNDATDIDIHTLGFSPFDLANYLEGIRRPNGILLISGPTGSGKTTTLYATLKLLNKESRNITTIEDPIEYTLEGVNQVQLKENIGLNFAEALRTFLRQDPNIIMVGEIRDPETANMAIRAALTGHLVLSTIHTNSAWGTVSRLTDMGIPPFLVASTLNTSVAQRLVRVLCPHCKIEKEFSKDLFPQKYKMPGSLQALATHFLPVGCGECFGTGYRGRKAVYEVVPIDRELSELIKLGKDEPTEQYKEKGIRTLSENALDLLRRGTTSLDEIYPLLTNF